MKRVWFSLPERHWFGWKTLLPWYVGGDEYGRRTLMLGWTVTGRVIVAISRPGLLYRPEPWQWEDELTGRIVQAAIYPYGGGVREHGIQLTVRWAAQPEFPLAVLRIPQPEARQLAELIVASGRMAWHDPRNADDPYWNPPEES